MGSHGRKRALALAAPDARTLLVDARLLFVVGSMTAAQMDQVQKVLDAAVVNPAVQKELKT